jgi:translation initiation factor 1
MPPFPPEPVEVAVSREDKRRIGTGGGAPLEQNAFASLNLSGLPAAAPGTTPVPAGALKPAGPPPAVAPRHRGRVEIRRTTAGRGGKTVTTVSGFVGIGLPEKEKLAKEMRAACGCGGTVKDGQIEIQGDNREKVAAILQAAGFRPVFAGG